MAGQIEKVGAPLLLVISKVPGVQQTYWSVG